MNEEKILQAIADFKSVGVTKDLKDTKKGKIYYLHGKEYAVEITIESNWLGLKFKSKTGLTYEVDTDLYNVRATSGKEKEFIDEIVSEIVGFLHRLAAKEILISEDGRLLAVPTNDGTEIIRIDTLSRYGKPLSEIKEVSDSTFRPVND